MSGTNDIIGTRRPDTAGLPMFEDQPKARASDPATSHDAAEETRTSPKAGSARYKLLVAFHAAGEKGLTDPEACIAAGLSLTSEYATRCSELENAEWVERTGEMRRWHTGLERIVRRITPAGRDVLKADGIV